MKEESIECISNLSLQQLFNRVVKHLIKQGRASTMQLICEDGTRCAIGCLLPPTTDHKAGLVLSYNSWPMKLVYNSTTDKMKRSMLRELLDIHDTGHTENWPDQFLEVSQEYKLNPNAIWS